MSDVVDRHHRSSPGGLAVAVVTVSDTRTLESDESGALIVSLLEGNGHDVIVRVLVPDEANEIRDSVESLVARGDVWVILLTGGTGISPRDRTPETIESVLTRPLPGFGELFRMLSHAEIGPAAILSRAVGGLIGEVAVFAMPGSRAAVRLAMTAILLPELPHIVAEARKV